MTDEPYLNDEQIKMLKKSYSNVPDHDFNLFVYQVQRTRLDPFAKQIYCINRGGKWGVSASIDGLRLIAYRTGRYRGQTAPMWCGPDGEWKDVWLDETKQPAACKIGVWMEGYNEPTYRVARWKSYAAPANPLWVKLGDVMIAKCAESLALRCVAPAEMSGIYTEEEMEQVDNELPKPPTQAKTTPVVNTPPKVVSPPEKAPVTTTAHVEMSNQAQVDMFMTKWNDSYSDVVDAPVAPLAEDLLKLTKKELIAKYNELPAVKNTKSK